MSHRPFATHPITRRAAGALVALAAVLSPLAAEAAETLRIGFQRSSTLVTLLKTSGELEKALAPEGVAISWHEFTSGLPLLEALAAGHVDVSADVADTVPVFAQAAGAKLVYFAEEAPSPNAQAILVPATSPIGSLEQLKGAKVAVTKGAGSHYLLLAALAKANLSIKDISPAYLTPADGRAAFTSGKVDAFVVWDPFLSSTQAQSGAKVLADGTDLASYKRYYLTTDAFAKRGAAILEIIYAQLKAKGAWVKAEPDAAAEQLAAQWKIEAPVIKTANGKRSYKVGAVAREGLVEQQKIADVFQAEGLFPKKVDATDLAVWRPANP